MVLLVAMLAMWLGGGWYSAYRISTTPAARAEKARLSLLAEEDLQTEEAARQAKGQARSKKPKVQNVTASLPATARETAKTAATRRGEAAEQARAALFRAIISGYVSKIDAALAAAPREVRDGDAGEEARAWRETLETYHQQEESEARKLAAAQAEEMEAPAQPQAMGAGPEAPAQPQETDTELEAPVQSQETEAEPEAPAPASLSAPMPSRGHIVIDGANVGHFRSSSAVVRMGRHCNFHADSWRQIELVRQYYKAQGFLNVHVNIVAIRTRRLTLCFRVSV